MLSGAECCSLRPAGILWNLSSSDTLKDRLARDTLEHLTDLILTPLSGTGSAAIIQQNASEAEIFYNSTGLLRYQLYQPLGIGSVPCALAAEPRGPGELWAESSGDFLGSGIGSGPQCYEQGLHAPWAGHCIPSPHAAGPNWTGSNAQPRVSIPHGGTLQGGSHRPRQHPALATVGEGIPPLDGHWLWPGRGGGPGRGWGHGLAGEIPSLSAGPWVPPAGTSAPPASRPGRRCASATGWWTP